MRLPLIVLLLLAPLSCACITQVHDEEEGEPVDLRDNLAEQGLIDCAERTDTGYTSGTSFPITVVTVDGKPAEVDTANAYWLMQQAAAQDGVAIRIVSGFRTNSEQTYLYGCYTNCNCNSCNLAARPGFSNHQSGHALDLNTSDTGVLTWLNNHGAAYGFERTVPSEAWHWEWWGGGPGGGPCGAHAYAAEFSAQSFPYASQTIVMHEGEILTGWFDLKNTGTASWDGNTKFAPMPRDASSPFADSSWLSPGRISSVAAVTQPGSVGRFPVTLRAGAPGESVVYFGLVQELVTWFADDGGPEDDLLAVRIQVVPRDWSAQLVAQTFPPAGEPLILTVGETVEGTFDLKNTGARTWTDVVRLAPTPRDQASPIFDDTWRSATRVVAPDHDTPKNDTARFTFRVTGRAVGDFNQTFSLVAEGITWFADQGGLLDGTLAVHVVVVPADAAEGEGEAAPFPQPRQTTRDDTTTFRDDDDDDGEKAGIAAAPLPPSVQAGCAATTLPATDARSGAAALLVAAFAILRRRQGGARGGRCRERW